MRSSRKHARAAGFTLAEIILVMAVLAIILGSVIVSFKGMSDEANLTKVETELNTVKDAIVSYWSHHDFTYPVDIASALLTSDPQIINPILIDPYDTDTVTHSYGYVTGSDATFGDYFYVYSKGPKGDTTAPTWDAKNVRVTYTGSGRVVSNAPVAKE